MIHRLYWFRHDLRLHDNPGLQAAAAGADRLTLVYCHDARRLEPTPWGFARGSQHQHAFLCSTLTDLGQRLAAAGNGLLETAGLPGVEIARIAAAVGAHEIHCEALPAPYEMADVRQLQAAGYTVVQHWQSSLIHPEDAPFTIDRLPRMYTYFRNAIEDAGVEPRPPIPAPASLPPPATSRPDVALPPAIPSHPWNRRSSFPYQLPAFQGGETAALAHMAQYFERGLAQSYDKTRNQLFGLDYSSKFSPWLALGALSPRTLYRALRDAEHRMGATEGTRSLWSELMWRDFFRYLHLRHGRRLYAASGIGHRPAPSHDPVTFQAWCQGTTGQPLIDAGMRELRVTGFLSNRLRQVVASYLVNELNDDWRAGAAWFEACLVDFDIFSNQGNWLAAAGRGPDARGRKFNPEKQSRDHDRQGTYRALWGT